MNIKTPETGKSDLKKKAHGEEQGLDPGSLEGGGMGRLSYWG